MPIFSAFLCGFIFGAGLVISGMTDPAKVLGFLDVLAISKGAWDPTLAIVMAAALMVSIPGLADDLVAVQSAWHRGHLKRAHGRHHAIVVWLEVLGGVLAMVVAGLLMRGRMRAD